MKKKTGIVLGMILVAGVAVVPVAASAAEEPAAKPQAAPNFQMPFKCGDSWRLDTWGHNPALDMVKEPNQEGTEGAALVAPAAGTVNMSKYHDNAGNVVQINHGGGHFTTYLHMKSRSVGVGDKVTQGQGIGQVGKTGPTSNGHPHLHFEHAVDSNGDGSASWGSSDSERTKVSFNGTEYTGASKTWRNVKSNNGC
jgi:hypothetical protein